MPETNDPALETPVVAEPVGTAESEVKEPTSAEILASVQASLTTERSAREKAERDLSSLRGTVRSQRDLEDSWQAEVTGINKHLELLAKGIAHPEDADLLPGEFEQVRMQRAADAQTTALQREYARLTDEFTDAIKGEDGKPLFEVDTAPELEEARRLWMIGKSNTELSPDSRRASLIRAVAEAAKATVITERKKIREEREMEKTQRATDRKKKLEESGELDLDTGAGGSRPSVKSWAQAQKIKKVSDLSDADYEKLIKAG